MSTALVTGATAGIGREFAVQLAAKGDDLVLVARDSARLDALAAELGGAHGVAVEVICADLSDRAALERVAERLRDPARAVDLLVNNAGYGLGSPFVDTTVEDEERLLDVLVRAVLVLSHAAAGAMVVRGSGRIINVSSVAGLLTSGTYAASKAWVITFSESIAAQLAPRGVGVTALLPGYVRTEFHERAGIDKKRNGPFWLDAPDLVRQALADSERGRVVSVPSPQYKAVVGVVRHLPRVLLRNPRVTALHRKNPSP
ncbi:short-chain dehydrogenase [Janibacter sp. Soil728]|uniref:SDR family NAD(P)-dependent oxidoreductase n=1 Tax=Janibacter sp. Soil728 TaxID=1736393 RepID=UPI0006FD4F5D|nr:SDR family oxidoreductase [Janibacter sp. Soil728]KRE39406.1 short-chain dehydrogenase [Janibacter sp. Soil728]